MTGKTKHRDFMKSSQQRDSLLKLGHCRKRATVDNSARPRHSFPGCVGRIGADRKGNAHLR
jgi:hypothetical protein